MEPNYYKTHKTRFSDSSLYDEVCVVCGASDYIGNDQLVKRPCTIDHSSEVLKEETKVKYNHWAQERPVLLYLEAHVTIEPVFDERRLEAAEIANKHSFKLADLLMKKRAEDTEERSSKDTFMTGHSKFRSDIEKRTKDLVIELQNAGFKVWRYKVEDTLLDSRNTDIWNLLT